jgi:hypothetical protein
MIIILSYHMAFHTCASTDNSEERVRLALTAVITTDAVAKSNKIRIFPL